MTYNAAHLTRPRSRWDRIRSWLADWLDRVWAPEPWDHGLSDDDLAEEFPQDVPRPGAEHEIPVREGTTSAGPGYPYVLPYRQALHAACSPGVWLDRRTLPVRHEVTWWRPRVAPYVRQAVTA